MPLGIYIQVPFCQTKCTYCNFHTGPAARGLYAPYARAVVDEIRDHAALYKAAGLADSAYAQAGTADTLYLGGGTPSLLDPDDLQQIVSAAQQGFRIEAGEVTLEADPETIDPLKAAAWRKAAINRISLGAQSFSDVELQTAGRMHRRQDIFRANEILRETGFSNISLDLIAGLAHQTEASWRNSVEQLVSLRPEHISIYLLEVDEASRLGREVISFGSRYGASQVPDDDAMAGYYEEAGRRLAEAGYEHYEISNWSLPGHRSRHNLKYWNREPYLGFGAGAHSFDGHQRWSNAHDAAAYVTAMQAGRLPLEQHEKVSPSQALEEEMFLGLRQLEGIDLERIERQYGVELKSRIEPLRSQGLIVREGPRVRLAPERLSVSNEVFLALLN